MHLCLEGNFKKFLNLWFITAHSKTYYLGPRGGSATFDILFKFKFNFLTKLLILQNQYIFEVIIKRTSLKIYYFI